MSIADKLKEVAQNQQRVYDAGYEKSQDDIEHLNAELEQTLYGTDSGGKSHYDEFWDVYQNYGKRVTYQYAFAGDSPGWTEEIFQPKYDIRLTGGYTATSMFWGCPIKDMVAHLDEIGRNIDMSLCWYFNNTFQNTKSKRWGTISMINGKGASYAFYNSSADTIEKWIVNESLGDLAYTFGACVKLINLTIEGVIGQNGLNLSWSPLSKTSITSVVNALSATTSGLTATLRLAAVNAAFETTPGANNGSTSDEWLALAATKSNWTINLINS